MVLGSAYGGCGVERKGLKPSQVNPGARRPPIPIQKMGENAKPGRKESSGTWFKLNPTRGEIGARLQGTSTVHPPFSAQPYRRCLACWTKPDQALRVQFNLFLLFASTRWRAVFELRGRPWFMADCSSFTP